MAKRKTKQEELADAVAEAVGAGKEVHLETVDFSDPNRPKTCLEVDFPIIPINHVATIEGNAGKPIYQMSKWWARRRSSVFRSLLIAAAAKAPDDPSEAAKLVWDSYYGNHQHNSQFQQLKVADIFMGGGTTVVEGARLGMQIYGCDLNPVAWFVTKNELAEVDSQEVNRLLRDIEAVIRPQIMPFYACNCPRGHKGQWTNTSTGEVMDDAFDPLSIRPEDRGKYQYQGPELVYAFWAKHGPCGATECDHRTPIMASPMIALKTLTVKAWIDWECPHCGSVFDIEHKEARMAPAALFVVSEDEKPYAIMDEDGRYDCPHCGHTFHEPKAAASGKSSIIGNSKNKQIKLTLFVHPEWLRGSPGADKDGNVFGGSVSDSAVSTEAWNVERARTLRLVEIRGVLPEQVRCPDTRETFYTDERGGTVPKRSAFTCMAPTCGQAQDVLTAIKASGKSGPVAPYAVQGYCPQCNKESQPYGGRFFDYPTIPAINAACLEWEQRRETDLQAFWPRSELPYGFMTHHNNGGIPNHGFTHWWTMFNPRQLLGHAQLLRAIVTVGKSRWDVREAVLGAFQQYVRNQSMFSFWHIKLDKLAPALSNSNFHPKSTMIEVGMFAPMGYGPWTSTVKPSVEGPAWRKDPWEIVSAVEVARIAPDTARQLTGKSAKVFPGDGVCNHCTLECRTATDLASIPDAAYDLVVTDPPFGGLLHYSELSDFFYVWLRLVMKDRYPSIFSSEFSPKALEAVANRARNREDPDGFYKRMLTECWRESRRVLKAGGILAFTFHHSEDDPWIAVLESLFEAGFYLEAAYPIRSDETKGEGSKPGTIGSQKIEYDIIHVCRIRVDRPEPVSWARLRREIMRDVRELEDLLRQHQAAGLQQADLQVIRRGKALEHFSRHYGQVYVERGREFSVKEALVGISTLLHDEQDTSAESPPVLAEPFTRQFLRLFTDRISLDRDQIQKYLRGTGVSPADFLQRGWCSETKKVFSITHPLELAKQWKGANRSGIARDYDQAMFLIGACYENSGIRVQDTLNSQNFTPHPATPDLLDWFSRHGGDADMKQAAQLAKRLYASWLAKNQPKVQEQLKLFDLED